MKKLLLAMSIVALLQPNLFGMSFSEGQRKADIYWKDRSRGDLNNLDNEYSDKAVRDAIDNITNITDQNGEKVATQQDQEIMRAHYNALKDAYRNNKSVAEKELIRKDFFSNIQSLRQKLQGYQATTPLAMPKTFQQPETYAPAKIDYSKYTSDPRIIERKLRDEIIELLKSPGSNLAAIKTAIEQLTEHKAVLNGYYQRLVDAKGKRGAFLQAAKDFKEYLMSL